VVNNDRAFRERCWWWSWKEASLSGEVLVVVLEIGELPRTRISLRLAPPKDEREHEISDRSRFPLASENEFGKML
jgi:hypothetical protein